MPVPDNTYFGETPEGNEISYGEVREIADDQRKIEILKSRLDSFLLRQINSLSLTEENGNYRVWSPFPLTVLTFLAVETLGHVISDVAKIRAQNQNEQSKILVTPIYQKMDVRLSHKPSKTFNKAFEVLHRKDDRKSLKHYSDIIHKYQRNTFNHGYQGRGVYLSHQLDGTWQIVEDGGYLILNPYRFWILFKEAYESIFLDILLNRNEDYRKNALKYFRRLLN